jgi:hypothetical protein
MITSIVFSKNRACQLDLLLSSIEKNFKDTDEIFVIYKHTDDLFQKAYDLLVEKFSKNKQMKFVLESDFQEDTVRVCSEAKNNYLAFFVDDDIVYRDVSINEFLDDAFTDNMSCISLRLGGNTLVQDCYTGQPCIIPDMHNVIEKDSDVLFVWNWISLGGRHTNFGYPFSVDGHVYPKEDIIPIIQQYEYDTPNAFEGRFDKNWLKPDMCCLKTSSVVNTPLNLVGSSQNRAGEQFGISLEELNNNYMEGFRISLEDMDFSNITGCHQELPITFKRGE